MLKSKKLIAILMLMAMVLCSCGTAAVELPDGLSADNEQYIYLSENDMPLEVHLDRDYDWYIDQGNTGRYRNKNCGPSSAVMVAKWYDESFPLTAEEARETYAIDGGEWRTTVIKRFLTKNDIPVNAIAYTYEEALKALNENKVLLACMNTKYISRSTDNTSHNDRFYDYEGGHFLVIKGYKFIDGQLYYEVYDPNNWNAKYEDGSEMGKDRYYDYKEMEESILNHWKYLFTIEGKDSEETK